MTRETKIGLLVGLAFIIVIGILLSDHINSSTDPVPAVLSQGYTTAERSVASPDRNQGTMTMVNPPPVIPQNPVVTQHDQPVAIDDGGSKVSIGPANDGSPLRIPPRPNDPNQGGSVVVTPPAANQQVAQNTNPDDGSSNPDPGAADPTNHLVKENPNDLEQVPAVHPPVGVPGVLRPPAPPKINGKEIKAEEGDTVSKLAAKYMGGNTKANREAFIKANPSVTPDGHLVFAGRTYIIPSAAGATAVALAPTKPATPAPSPAPLKPGISLYTVKDNDSLWKIAAEQLGSGTRWQEIRDLNQDLLKGSEQVHVNMRLKLPPKAVASTN